MSTLRSQRRIIPGFGMSLGFTVTYLSAVILLPLGYLVWRSTHMAGERTFWEVVSSRTVVRSYWNSTLASALAAGVNVPLGLLIAWVLVRYRFWGRKLMDAVVDLPFALPTAVAGIALAKMYSEKGLIGEWLKAFGVTYPWPVWQGWEGRSWPLELKWFGPGAASTAEMGIVGKAPLGIAVAMVFVGLPFVVRTVQPVIEDLDPAEEEGAASLGATRWQTFWRVTAPKLWPALLTGFALAFARGLGEFGSIIFLTGGNRYAEVAPEKIMQQLESGTDIEVSVSHATATAVVLLGASFVMLLVINLLQRWMARRGGR